MLLAIGILLVIGWVTGFLVFHVTSFAIHVLLVFAVIAIVMHLMREEKRRPEQLRSGWRWRRATGRRRWA